MSPERWERIKQLCDEARSRPAVARAAFLAEACAGDEALHHEVQVLLDQPIETTDVLRPLRGPTTAPSETVFTGGVAVGPYRIIAALGAGGMGRVFRAHDAKLSRDVALKVLPGAFASDPDRVARFQREARLLAALNHPNIATIYGLEETHGQLALVLELVEGGTLADRLSRGAMPIAEALSVARQIAAALAAAHDKGIVHRDLKPANISLTRAGVVKVLDFGIAKVTGVGAAFSTSETAADTVAGTSEGIAVGTPAYMSPEQARGLGVDRRTDIWAFGCVLFEMLSGTKAFAGVTPIDALAAVLHHEPPWQALPPDTPRPVRQLLERCLQRDLDTRVRESAELSVALEDAIPGVRQRGGKAADAISASIAVLPFTNMSADPENEYFGDGLAEEVINLLAQIPSLKVIARTSAFMFKGKQEDVRRIAEILDVAYVLEGSVRKAGNQLRVTAQLIVARDGSHLWSKRYDRDLADVFAIQDEIAQAIAVTLHTALGGWLSSPPTPSLAAYEAFLRYRHYEFNKGDLARALACLEESISLDPRFALAYGELGRHFLTALTVQAMPAHDAASLVRRHAEKALEIDPSLPEAHGVLGGLAALYDYDWTEADRRFRVAFAREPASLNLRLVRANFFLAHAGRGHEAVEDMERVLTEDPLSWGAIWASAVALRSVGRDAEADARYKQLVQIDAGPLTAIPAVVLSGNHLARGETGDALRFAEIAYAKNPTLPAGIGQLAGMIHRTSSEEHAKHLVDQLLPGTTFGAPFGLALYHLALGDVARCAAWLEHAIEQRDVWVSFLLNVGNIGGRVMRTTSHWPRLAGLMNIDFPSTSIERTATHP